MLSPSNEAGQIIGYSNEAEVRRAFVWENGVMIDLGSLGDYSIEHVAINEAGEVIGWSNTTGNAYAMRHAFVANAGMPPPTVAIIVRSV
jgi:probable HAF family extracellular repeat protein